jgi:FlaA1/EpsC-like NDP-sugar epimerase
VVPIFREQIARGGPVTVTDPEMRRYFMTVREAVLLVLQAGAIGQGGQVMVLDMGEPVRIVDLARQMITLSGFEPDKDIPIAFTGIRPGEKLFEDILTAEEGTDATRHDRIFVARGTGTMQGEELQACILRMHADISAGDRSALLQDFRRIVPSYQPDVSTWRENTSPALATPQGLPAATTS